MLHEFITTHRTLLIDRWEGIVASRSSGQLARATSAHGIPVFLDQVVKRLSIEECSDPRHADPLSRNRGAGHDPDVGLAAMLHGRDLLVEGLTVEQVVREYGDVCLAVTNLAVETGAPISAHEFRTFNRCLDDAIAGAVTEYSRGNGTGWTKADLSTPNTTEDLETALTQSKRALASTEVALSAAQLDAQQAKVRALHDSLTGLPNRELFDDRLAHAIALAARHDWTLAVMFLDLDQFKAINDAHGHATGDTVLKTIAQRLLQFVRDEDTVCRNGGDEFLYLLMNPRGRANIGHVADSVLRSVAQPVAIGDRTFAVKPSIGIAIFPEHASGGAQLITNADAAMYRAKKNVRGVAFFDRKNGRDSAA